jgi:hypothetical protein
MDTRPRYLPNRRSIDEGSRAQEMCASGSGDVRFALRVLELHMEGLDVGSEMHLCVQAIDTLSFLAGERD